MNDIQTQQGGPVLADYTSDDGARQTLTLDVVRYYFCPSATPADAALFAATCQQMRLNPFTRDASLVKYGGSPASVIVSKDAILKRADRMDAYGGMEHGVIYAGPDGEVRRREGQAVYRALGERLLGGWARVYREGRKPTYAEVSLDEYDTGKSLWKSKPAVMIDKVAQATALRGAFPQELSGYDASEIPQAGGRAPEPARPLPERPAPAPRPAPRPTDAEKAELSRVAEAIGGDRQAVWRAYLDGGIEAARALAPQAPGEAEPEGDGDGGGEGDGEGSGAEEGEAEEVIEF